MSSNPIKPILSASLSNFNYRCDDINNNGVQTGHFMINDMTSTEKRNVEIKFKLKKQLLSTFEIAVNGLPVQKRQ